MNREAEICITNRENQLWKQKFEDTNRHIGGLKVFEILIVLGSLSIRGKYSNKITLISFNKWVLYNIQRA